MKTESVIDKPVDKLDPVVWAKDADGIHVLTPEARQKIQDIVDFMVNDPDIRLQEYNVNITGSITSNQWKDDSDIDIHFNSPEVPQDEAEEFNKKFREVFEKKFMMANPEDGWHIGMHPVEVYFQANPFQDYMSVGCYDFINGKWLVGPEFKDGEYDPMSDLYADDMKHVSSIIGDIRSIILGTFELAVSIQGSDDEDFIRVQSEALKSKLAEAAVIFRQSQEYRKLHSSPTSIEDALEKRSSRKWKIADSSFKLLDRFGYLKILRTYTQLSQDLM